MKRKPGGQDVGEAVRVWPQGGAGKTGSAGVWPAGFGVAPNPHPPPNLLQAGGLHHSPLKSGGQRA